MGSQRVGHNWATNTHTHICITLLYTWHIVNQLFFIKKKLNLVSFIILSIFSPGYDSEYTGFGIVWLYNSVFLSLSRHSVIRENLSPHRFLFLWWWGDTSLWFLSMTGLLLPYSLWGAELSWFCSCIQSWWEVIQWWISTICVKTGGVGDKIWKNGPGMVCHNAAFGMSWFIYLGQG